MGDDLMNKTYNDFVEKYGNIDYEDENSQFMKNVKKLIKVSIFSETSVVLSFSRILMSPFV